MVHYLLKTRTYEWCKAFKSGRDLMKDLSRSNRPSTSVTENPHSTLREISVEFSVSHESIRTILNNRLGVKNVADWLVQKDLIFLQKLRHS